MQQREIDLVLEACQEADWLVSQDPGTADLEVLERARLKMNDLLMARRWDEAIQMAYAITLRHAGRADEADIIERMEN